MLPDPRRVVRPKHMLSGGMLMLKKTRKKDTALVLDIGYSLLSDGHHAVDHRHGEDHAAANDGAECRTHQHGGQAYSAHKMSN